MKKLIIACLTGLTCIFVVPECPAVKKGSSYKKTFKVTAYCPCKICCGKWSDGHTADGHKIQPGDKFVAAPAEYPFGTTMMIPFYGTVKVRDRGGAIKGNCLDVFFPTHEQALRWGIKVLDVEIYE